MKNSLVFWSLLFVSIIFCWGCPKNCLDATYSFNATVQIMPDKDSIAIGDTIFIISSFPAQIKDQNTGQTIDYSGLKNSIGTTLSIGEFIEGQSLPKDAVADFDYFNLKGRVYNDRSIASPDGVQQLQFEERDSQYQMHVGIIAKRKGIYGFGIGNGLGISKNCTRAQVNIAIANSNQHLYFYQNFRPNYVLSDYDKNHGYFFKVN